jgi:alkanesulfonate monooxygenase SsuD/methylene tetrahydromethanopterin reductase-like flavin-dependent oxidoreductase (luciferase family)
VGAPLRRFRFGVQQECAATGAAWLDGARRAEALGFDSLLMPDHFGPQFGPLAGLSAEIADLSPRAQAGPKPDRQVREHQAAAASLA